MSLLDKFNTVEIKSMERISFHDKSAMEELQHKYLNSRKLLFKYLNKMNRLQNELENDIPNFGEINYKPNFDKQINTLNNDIENNNKRFINQIEKYFNETYNLNLSCRQKHFSNIDSWSSEPDKQELKDYLTRLINYKDLVDDLLDQVDGDLNQATTDRVTMLFKTSISRYSIWDNKDKKGQLKIKINKNKLSLIDYFYYRYDWNKNAELNTYDSSHTKILIDALNLFFETTYNDYCIKEDSLQVDFKRIYGNSNIKIKLYKNGKVDLTFNDIETLNKFDKMFNLNENKFI
jgi:hypothetical protein